jgi:hypothetical protein
MKRPTSQCIIKGGTIAVVAKLDPAVFALIRRDSLNAEQALKMADALELRACEIRHWVGGLYRAGAGASRN